MIEILLLSPIAFLILFPALLLSLSFHEFAHAWMADRLGDPTPRYQGRLTLDPRSHLEPLGVLAILFTRFGWGRPVEFDPYNLKEPIRDTAIIAAAGPASNILIATVLTLIVKTGVIPSSFLASLLLTVVSMNIGLAIFNLVPIYPLDGSKIVMAFLPKRSAYEYELFMERYGLYALIFLLLPWSGQSIISRLIGPLIAVVENLLFMV